MVRAFKKRVSLDMSGKRTIVIEEDMIWLLIIDCKCVLDKLLYKLKQLKQS